MVQGYFRKEGLWSKAIFKRGTMVDGYFLEGIAKSYFPDRELAHETSIFIFFFSRKGEGVGVMEYIWKYQSFPDLCVCSRFSTALPMLFF